MAIAFIHQYPDARQRNRRAEAYRRSLRKEAHALRNTIPTAAGCRSSSTRPPTASSRRFRSTPVHRHARALAHASARRATRSARRKPRRDFLVSACGAATTLLAFNAAFARARPHAAASTTCRAKRRSTRMLARSTLDKGEFVFDVQGHFVNPTGAWTQVAAAGRAAAALRHEPGDCEHARRRRASTTSACLGRDAFVKDVFLDSDTDLIVLSFVPSTREGEPLTIEEAAATARDRRADGGHASHAAARARQSEPGGRPREHGHARASSTRSRRSRRTRSGGPTARASSSTTTSASRSSRRRASSACATSPCTRACRSAQQLLRALDVRRRRPRREALPRRELPDLSLGIRRGQAGRRRTTRRAPTASTRWSRACSRTTSSPAATSTPSSARRGAS